MPKKRFSPEQIVTLLRQISYGRLPFVPMTTQIPSIPEIRTALENRDQCPRISRSRLTARPSATISARIGSRASR